MILVVLKLVILGSDRSSRSGIRLALFRYIQETDFTIIFKCIFCWIQEFVKNMRKRCNLLKLVFIPF